MIVGTFRDFTVGKRYVINHITDDTCKVYKNIPVFILRKVSMEDYLAYQAEKGNKLPDNFRDLATFANFYEISVD